jgi:hypothetical protein
MAKAICVLYDDPVDGLRNPRDRERRIQTIVSTQSTRS